MQDTLFRRYDLRGIVGTELIIDEVPLLTQALAVWFRKHVPAASTIIVGRDGRAHSPAIAEHIEKTFMECGYAVLSAGVCPTPAIYHACATSRAEIGIMITASHNGAEYNGLKIVYGATCVWGDALQEIRALYRSGAQCDARRHGTITPFDLRSDYLAYLVAQCSKLIGLEERFVIDCSGGAAAVVMPELREKCGWRNCIVMNGTLDPQFTCHEPDPTERKNMDGLAKALADHDAAFGIAFDGDADRVVLMLRDGTLVPGDQLLALFAQEVLSAHPGASVVFDVKCSDALIEAIESAGGSAYRVPTGHTIIKERMKHYGALLGGELSGHYFFADRGVGYDDGMYGAVRILQLYTQAGKSFEQLLAALPQRCATPELRVTCARPTAIIDFIEQHAAAYQPCSIDTLDGIRITTSDGWALIRASNTQPVLSMRCEARDAAKLQQIEGFMNNLIKLSAAG